MEVFEYYVKSSVSYGFYNLDIFSKLQDCFGIIEGIVIHKHVDLEVVRSIINPYAIKSLREHLKSSLSKVIIGSNPVASNSKSLSQYNFIIYSIIIT